VASAHSVALALPWPFMICIARSTGLRSNARISLTLSLGLPLDQASGPWGGDAFLGSGAFRDIR
jgi:hypothetical protein